MTSSPESLHAINSALPSKANEVILEKAFLTPRQRFLRKIASISYELYEIIKLNPALIGLLEKRPEILRFLSDRTILNKLLKDPSKLYDFLSNPKKFLGEVSAEENVTPNIIEKPTKKNELQNPVLQPKIPNLPKKPLTVPVNIPGPHRLEPEFIAKAHIENPNIRLGTGEIKPQAILNIPLLPHGQELEPDLITTARAFALNPELLKLMAAEAIATSKVKRPQKTDEEIETENLKSLSEDDTVLKEIHNIDSSEAIHKINPHIKE